MDVNKMQELESLLSTRKAIDVRARVGKRLFELGLDKNLKGFNYLLDIITLSIIYRNYSRTTIAELTPFIAKKNFIKPFSVQRQLRYVCTIKTNGKYKVHDICEQTWRKIKLELEFEEEREGKYVL